MGCGGTDAEPRDPREDGTCTLLDGTTVTCDLACAENPGPFDFMETNPTGDECAVTVPDTGAVDACWWLEWETGERGCCLHSQAQNRTLWRACL